MKKGIKYIKKNFSSNTLADEPVGNSLNDDDVDKFELTNSIELT